VYLSVGHDLLHFYSTYYEKWGRGEAEFAITRKWQWGVSGRETEVSRRIPPI
jgi:hypothetical protein